MSEDSLAASNPASMLGQMPNRAVTADGQSFEVVPLGDLEERHARGAYFTPGLIAKYLAEWAVSNNPDATILDPNCGGGIFLEAAGTELLRIGTEPSALRSQLFGIDLHAGTIDDTRTRLQERGLSATFLESDFFDVSPPNVAGARFPQFDAVLGNPPFVRFQNHRGHARVKSSKAALAQGVILPNNASSWAASLVHASAFVKPTGTLAWVVPAELLTVAYAEPVRQWLRSHFSWVRLVFIERLQFSDAQERVVLLIASGSGGCESFTLSYVQDSEDLANLHALDVGAGVPAATGKWTDMLLTMHEKGVLRRASQGNFVPLDAYGKVVLGTVTGANKYFCITEARRQDLRLEPNRDVIRTLPSPARFLSSQLTFTDDDWTSLRESGEPVWMLSPDLNPEDEAPARYLARGHKDQVHTGYKCSHRGVWWRIPVVEAPDLFFTYMSHRMPRLVANEAGTTFLNSLHGIRLHDQVPKTRAEQLALVSLNSATLLWAELSGRSYGGGVLKLEPTEAASLQVPSPEVLDSVWNSLTKTQRNSISNHIRAGRLDCARELVDRAVLIVALGMTETDVVILRTAADRLRTQRMGTPATSRG